MTDDDALLERLQAAMPIKLGSFAPFEQATGLVIVDEVNGFLRRRRRQSRTAGSRRSGREDGRGDRATRTPL